MQDSSMGAVFLRKCQQTCEVPLKEHRITSIRKKALLVYAVFIETSIQYIIYLENVVQRYMESILKIKTCFHGQ